MAGNQARRIGFVATGIVLGLVGIGAGAAVARIVHAARALVTPPKRPWSSSEVLEVGEREVTLRRSKDVELRGRYGLWTDGDRGYAKVGDVLQETEDTVTRELIAAEDPPLEPGLRARLGAAFYRSPAELGVPVEDVLIATPVGAAPAWLVQSDERQAQDPAAATEDAWAILVHGRDAGKWETIRAVPVLRAAGFTTLIVSYRNDPGAPAAPDGRYHLGLAEWEDVEAAIGFALARGAQRIVLAGWSMGGATILQTLERTTHAETIEGVILDSAAVDWRAIIDLGLEQQRVIGPLRTLFLKLLTTPWGARIIGLDAPIDLGALDRVRHVGRLRIPLLVLHSRDDRVVPVASARAFAAARPDLVTYEEFEGAGHVRIWNLHQERYEAAIRSWLERLRSARRTGASERTAPTTRRSGAGGV